MTKGKVRPIIHHVPKITVYWGNYESTSFSFHAFGETRKKCLENLVTGWIEHCREYEVLDEYVHEEILTIKEDFNTVPIIIDKNGGVCFRDGYEMLKYDNTFEGYEYEGRKI